MLKFKNILTNAVYYNKEFLQLKHRNSDIFRHCSASLHQGVYIKIYV